MKCAICSLIAICGHMQSSHRAWTKMLKQTQWTWIITNKSPICIHLLTHGIMVCHHGLNFPDIFTTWYQWRVCFSHSLGYLMQTINFEKLISNTCMNAKKKMTRSLDLIKFDSCILCRLFWCIKPIPYRLTNSAKLYLT